RRARQTVGWEGPERRRDDGFGHRPPIGRMSRTVTGGGGTILRGEAPGRSRISGPSAPPDRAAEGGTLWRRAAELHRYGQGALARLIQAEGNRTERAKTAGLQLPGACLERCT